MTAIPSEYKISYIPISMSMPRSSITWVGPIVSSWAIGDPQIVNHDEEGAEICAALRFSWFSYDDVM